MKVLNLDDRFCNIKDAYLASERKLDELHKLNAEYAGSGVFLAINGSLARKELVNGSDFDAFIVKGKEVDDDFARKLWQGAQNALGLRGPGSTGVFGSSDVIRSSDML
jgi:hypothetical protein